MQKLSQQLKDHNVENTSLKTTVEDAEEILQTTKLQLESKVEELEDYKMSRNELEAFLVASLEECTRLAQSEGLTDQKGPLPERIRDYNAQQRQSLLQDILQKLDAEYEGGRGLRTSSTARSGSNIYMPSLSTASRPYSSNLQFLDGVIDGNVEGGDIFNVASEQEKAAKSTVGIQTSALFTPEVEFYRQTIKGRERKWGEMAQSLPLTHKDTRTH